MIYFTSEAVSAGHPDKICDKVADRILDEALKLDKNAKVACEVCVTTDFMLVFGEITINSKKELDYEKIARDTVKQIGYDDPKIGFDYKTFNFLNKVEKQSSDISSAVNKEEQGAGDQGIIFGYACDETKNYMPLAIYLANNIVKELENVRIKGIIKGLRPDCKTQVTVQYDDKNKPVRIDNIVLSSQHSESKDLKQLEKELIEKVIKKVVPKKLIDKNTIYHINPSGRFVIGGPNGDSGLTGRKLMCDTYGGYSRHGGGAFSGKDSSKVDRSAAYMARYVAKNVVASGIAKRCEIQLSYAIGVSRPVSIYLTTFGTGKIDDIKILEAVKKNFDFRPSQMDKLLDLRSPIYAKTSTYSHFQEGFNWEKTDKVEIFKKLLK